MARLTKAQLEQQAEAQLEIRRLREDLLLSKRTIKLWQDKAGRTSDLEALARALSCRPSQRSIKPTKSTRHSESAVLAIASDWHVEEPVNPKTVNGLNEYNLEVARSRIQAFFRKTLRLVEIERSATTVDTLVLGLLGDFISGYIHPELEENNLLSPIEAVMWVEEEIAAGIRFLRKEGGFKRILIPCCAGNHARTTIRMRFSTFNKDSYETLLYTHLSKSLSDDVVKFVIGDGYHNIVPIFDRPFRFHHGHSIRYQGGVGGITIPANKAIASWNVGRTPAYFDIFGHWHQFLPSAKFQINGSLIGYNAFALEIKAPFERPSQSLIVVEKDLGITAQRAIYV